jgi:hypothetical protein
MKAPDLLAELEAAIERIRQSGGVADPDRARLVDLALRIASPEMVFAPTFGEDGLFDYWVGFALAPIRYSPTQPAVVDVIHRTVRRPHRLICAEGLCADLLDADARRRRIHERVQNAISSIGRAAPCMAEALREHVKARIVDGDVYLVYRPPVGQCVRHELPAGRSDFAPTFPA